MRKQRGGCLQILKNTTRKRAPNYMGSGSAINHRQNVPAYCDQFHLTGHVLIITEGWLVENDALVSEDDSHVGSAEIDGQVGSAPGSKGRKIYHSPSISLPVQKVSE